MKNKCDSTREVLGAYLYGELPPLETRSIRIHIENCADCRAEMRSLEDMISHIPEDQTTGREVDKLKINHLVNGYLAKELSKND